ncbi:sugar-binding domain-containing protein [Enterococcus hulanensis]|uniref:sugar-binding transcriptional regulator n=1 Tax=Enterococcus hulanensis TaxID=2559929 RepID=UPI00288ED79C|nr:sugar-binding domain-containing protein [Enterococcus hulanensis]MDT2660749.1 sugar-binding domain-containing protein [Enterococcus hulanensis]
MSDDLMFRVLKRYYVLNENQDTIAQSENTSKSTISRLLKKGEKLGFVRHVVDIPIKTHEELEHKLVEKYNLSLARVVPTESENIDLINFNVTLSAGHFLNQTIKSGDTIGVSWGETLTAFVNNLPEYSGKIDNVRVVQLNGSVSLQKESMYGDGIVRRIAANYGGSGYILPTPSLVDSPEIAGVLKQDSTIRSHFNLIEKCNITLFSVGAMRDDSVLIEAGYFTKENYAALREQDYCADICSKYIRSDGSYVIDDLYNRGMGISLEHLKQKECNIGLVAGHDKYKAALAALRGGYITHLFIDEQTAKLVLDEEEKEKTQI